MKSDEATWCRVLEQSRQLEEERRTHRGGIAVGFERQSGVWHMRVS